MVLRNITFVLALATSQLYAQVDVLTAQYNLSRTSSNTQEQILNRTNVNSSQFGKLFSRALDAPFYASPLIVTNFNVPGVGQRNLVYIATLGNTVYAFDADDPHATNAYWSVSLGTPFPRPKGCCYLGPTIGVLSTPVIDRSTNTIYLTAIVKSTDVGLYVFALDLGTGALKFNSPRRITYTFPSGVTKTDASQWLQRAGLLLFNNVLYVGTSAVWEGDTIQTQEGFIQAYKANDLGVLLANFLTTPTSQGGGFWQAGRGIAADSSGNVFAAVNSGAYNPPSSFGDSVVKFGPGSLSPSDWFTPANWKYLHDNNLDMSANGVTLIPGTNLAFAGGKTGVVFLLDQTSLGGLEPGPLGNVPLQQFQASHGCGGAQCGQHLPTAYWPHATTPYLYVWDLSDTLRAYPFDSASRRFLTGSATAGTLFPSRVGGMTVSSNGNSDGTGIVWTTSAAQDPFDAAVPGTLRAYNANDITQELYNSDQNSCRDAMGTFVKMSTPIVANGKVYVNTQSNVLPVYGLLSLLPSPVPPPGTVHVTVRTSPDGPVLKVDGGALCTGAAEFDWAPGSLHTLAAASPQVGLPGTSPQAGTPGKQFVWSGWSDGGDSTHTVAPAGNTTYTANFTTQYLLTTDVLPEAGGSIVASPASAGGYYNAGNGVQLTATPIAGCAFANWSGALTGTVNPQTVTMSAPRAVTANFQCSTPPPASFLTGYAHKLLRSDFSGWVGMKFTVGANSISVSAVGRVLVYGNSGTHPVKLVNADGSDVAGGSVSISMTGGTAGKFKYASLASPVTLAPNTTYYLASLEVAGGDQWYDFASVSSTNAAAVKSSIYSPDGTSWLTMSTADTSYVPVNFLYSIVTPVPIAVTVQASPAGPSFSVDGSPFTAAQSLNWTAGSPHTIATTTPQSAGAGIQYAWSGWSDGGAISHTVAPTNGAAYTANFTTQYLLTRNISPAGGGSIAASPSLAGGYYDAGTGVQLTATATFGCTFVNWSGALTGTVNPQIATMSAPQTVTANFQCNGPPPTSFVNGYALNAPPLRNDFSGWVGMKLTVGANPLAISSLGRICVANNALTHTVKFVNAGNGSDVPGALASVNMAGCTPGQFVYAAVSSTLAPGTTYYLVTQEAQAQDKWYEQDSISTTNAAMVNSSVYSFNGTYWIPINAANTSYVPPNFQYSVVTPAPIAVTVQTSPAGASFSVDGSTYSSAQALNWTSGLSHTIGTTSPQSLGTGARNVWSGWSDGGAISHTVAPTSGATYTANFTTQYLLTGNVSPAGGGSIAASPSSADGYYNAGSPVQLTAAASSGCTFVNWSGALAGAVNPQTVTMSGPRTVTANFQCTGPPPTSFVTGYALNGPPLRNDFTGWVGMKLTVGANPLAVVSLGRICVANNALTHTVKFVNAGNGSDVPGALASVNMAGCTPGQFVYAAIGSTLAPGTTYYLVSQETQAQDKWYEQDSISTTNAAMVNSSVYSFDGAYWIPINAANTSYVPPNFQYSVVTPSPIAVTVQTSLAGASFSVDGSAYTSAQALTWTSGSPHTIATTSPQNAGTGTRGVWSSWSDGGAISHTVAPTSGAAYTANFTTQYLLTSNVSPAGGGSIAASPSSAGGYYNAGNPVQLTAAAISGCTFVNWSGALAGTANPQTVTMSGPQTVTANFQCTGPPLTSFVTGYALNGPPLRNDFTGWVGMKLTVGANSLTVASLGRICVANNAMTHTVKFVNAGNGSDVPGASVSLNMAGCTPGQFVYGAVSPIILTAGASYYLVSQETQAQDRWYDQGTVSVTNAAAVNNSVYSYGGGWIPNTANASYVPVNFQYSVVANNGGG